LLIEDGLFKKMKPKGVAALLFLVGFWPMLGQAQTPLSLDDAMRRALQKHPDLQQAQ
jgi:hypothetical protein